jgi:hypothetical protein
MRRAATTTTTATARCSARLRRTATAGLCSASHGRHRQRTRQQRGRQASGKFRHEWSSTVLAPFRGRIVKLFNVSFVRRNGRASRHMIDHDRRFRVASIAALRNPHARKRGAPMALH